MHAVLLFAEAPPLSLELRLPLSILHFLEFAIWGAWFVVLGNYLNSLHFSRKDIGRIYATMALGSVIAPMFMGTIADRYIPSEILMGVSHLVGAVLLFAMARITTPRAFYWTALAYALVYSPTLILVNSVVFRHVPDAARDFPTIRVLGTIGWIAAGMSLRLMIRPGQPVNNRPLLLAAVLSVVLGVYSLLTLVTADYTLPTTPPLATASGEIPFLKAFTLLEERSFAVFYGVSFFITLALAFYYSWTALFLEKQVGVKSENVGPIMTIGQWVEIFFMFTLPWFLEVLGMHWVLTIGMAAWAVRYALFAAGGPVPLIILGVALHGICFDFFFTAGFIHVEKSAPPDIQASGQAFFGVLTYGLGMWLGTEASGWLNHWFTVERPEATSGATVRAGETIRMGADLRREPDATTGAAVRVTDWRKFWLVPCVGVIIALVVFVALS